MLGTAPMGIFCPCSIISPTSELCKLLLFYTGGFGLPFPILSTSLVNQEQLLLKSLKKKGTSFREVNEAPNATIGTGQEVGNYFAHDNEMSLERPLQFTPAELQSLWYKAIIYLSLYCKRNDFYLSPNALAFKWIAN